MLYVLSAVVPPSEYVETVAEVFTEAIVSSTSWRVRLNALPTLVVFWYRNLTSFSEESVSKMMDVLLQCLHDENLEVREMAAKTLSSVLRSSQRQRIMPLKVSLVTMPMRLIADFLPYPGPICAHRPHNETSVAAYPRLRSGLEKAARCDPRCCRTHRCLPVCGDAVDATVM